MRFEICAAATLLVGNFALTDRSPPPPSPAAFVSVVESHWTWPSTENNPAEAEKLAALWMAHNAGFHPPVCEQYDPLAVLDADVDPSPGNEHVIGNRRYGVAMYAQDGVLLARMAPIGCVAAKPGDQSLSLSSHGRLVVRTRQLEPDGEHLDVHLIEREGDEIRTILTLDVGGDRADASREWQVTGQLSFRGDEVEVKHHGRQRKPGGAWREVDTHCTWKLATRSFSCRTRAEARTSRWE